MEGHGFTVIYVNAGQLSDIKILSKRNKNNS
jgi:hypothetical protein